MHDRPQQTITAQCRAGKVPGAVLKSWGWLIPRKSAELMTFRQYRNPEGN